MSKITVIVPTYNVEQYIRTCLDSLIKQTFKDFEVWVVNDGSPANEQAIAEEYAQKHPFIKAIKKENGGYGSVLQYSIENITSEYCLICDPDDYLSPDALEVLYKEAITTNADIIIGAKYFIYTDGGESTYDKSYNKTYVSLKINYAYEKGSKEFDDLFFVDPSPHSKLYRHSILTTIKFPTKISFTDNLLFYIALLKANKVSYVSNACSYYLIDREGNTSTDLKPRVLEQHTIVFSEIIKQASNVTNVPDIFYYRMFEAFKFIFYTSRRIEAQKEVIEKELINLYQVVELLKPHKQAIMNYYYKYNKSGKNEQRKDKLILSGCCSKFVYKRWIKQLVGER